MRCPRHHRNEVTGYCSVCGEFGCAECLTNHEGKLFCQRDYRPIAEKQGREERRQAQLARPERQRLVVRFKDGKTLCGICFALNINGDGFHLDVVDKQGHTMDETRKIAFSDIKAVYYVKSFDGKFDKSLVYRETQVNGTPLVVEFNDGEVLHGSTTKPYNGTDPRFYLIPEDPNSNNISALVEASAVKAVYTRDEYKRKHQHELAEYLKKHRVHGVSTEELRGDYHFEKAEYVRAMKHYRVALREEPDSVRLRKKIISAQYNIGMRHLKHHEYTRALACMKMVLEADPENKRAKQKLDKLRHYMRKRRNDSARGEARPA